jgi:acetylornithine deacetylase/succinyl-diaminopimelate desuccinylase-like protein
MGKLKLFARCGLAVLVLAAGGRSQTNLTDPTAEVLKQLIRIDSVNPPGRDVGVAEFLTSTLAPLGFQIETIPTPVTGKVHFLARLKGNGAKKPILLAAHADVVGVERAGWHLDPFAGQEEDGYVYGRGAIDNKGSLAVFTEALIRLAKQKIPLERDIILLAEADEESGRYGTEWLAQNYFQKIDCAAALNEGGWIIENSDGSVRYMGISTADKISAWVKLTAHGTTSHSSMPFPNDAISQLAKALSELANYRTKVHLLSSTRQFFLMLAQVSQAAKSEQFEHLVNGPDPQQVEEADLEVSKDPLLNAIMRNTFAPVFLSAGFRGNVIPGSAETTINLRLLPGTNIDEILAEIRGVIHNSQIDISLAGGDPSAKDDVAALRKHYEEVSAVQPSATDTELYRALALQGQAAFHAPVTPYLFQAGTDAEAWRKRGIPVYGIYPYPIASADLSRMHGDDERVRVRSLAQGTEMIYKVLLQVAAAGSAAPSQN